MQFSHKYLFAGSAWMMVAVSPVEATIDGVGVTEMPSYGPTVTTLSGGKLETISRRIKEWKFQVPQVPNQPTPPNSPSPIKGRPSISSFPQFVPQTFTQAKPICVGKTCNSPLPRSTYNSIRQFFEDALTKEEVARLPENLNFGGAITARALAEALEAKQRQNLYGPFDHSQFFIFRSIAPECARNQQNHSCRSPVTPLPHDRRYHVRIRGYNAASNTAPLKGAQLFLDLIKANLKNLGVYFNFINS